MVYNFKDIKGVHLELTTKCNANCPMCGRNAFGVVRPDLQLIELSLDDCKKIFPSSFLSQLKNMSICGVYGDPILARDLLEIIKYIYSVNPDIKIDIYTNGEIHSASWWKKMAQIIGNGKVIFGIDGLADTANIHRRNTVFATVIRNARVFIEAGGRAEWDFIVFKHNEHQVEEARTLAQKLGFEIFQVKRTSRFYRALYEHDPALEGISEKFGTYPVYDSRGRRTGYIELPENPYYRNDSLKTIEALIKEFGSLISYFDETPIDCQARRTGGIFISAAGLVFPCCWFYQQVNYGTLYHVTDSLELNEEKILRETGGMKQILAKEHSLKDIVEGGFFKRIARSWRIAGLAVGRPKVCARACGYRLDMHARQHEENIG